MAAKRSVPGAPAIARWTWVPQASVAYCVLFRFITPYISRRMKFWLNNIVKHNGFWSVGNVTEIEFWFWLGLNHRSFQLMRVVRSRLLSARENIALGLSWNRTSSALIQTFRKSAVLFKIAYSVSSNFARLVFVWRLTSQSCNSSLTVEVAFHAAFVKQHSV